MSAASKAIFDAYRAIDNAQSGVDQQRAKDALDAALQATAEGKQLRQLYDKVESGEITLIEFFHRSSGLVLAAQTEF